MHLHPQLALGRTTGDDVELRLEVLSTHGAQDVLRAVADALDDGAEDMSRGMAQGQSPHHAARQGVGIGRAVALKVIEYDQAVRTDGYVARQFGQDVVGVYTTLSGLGGRVARELVLE